MSNQIDSEKLEDQLRLTKEVVAVMKAIITLQNKRIDNLEDWIRKLNQKVEVGF